MISSSQRPLPDNTRHSQQTNIHAPGGIRTHDLSRRAAAGAPYIYIYIYDISSLRVKLVKMVHTLNQIHQLYTSILQEQISLIQVCTWWWNLKHLNVTLSLSWQEIEIYYLRSVRVKQRTGKWSCTALLSSVPWRHGGIVAGIHDLSTRWSLHLCHLPQLSHPMPVDRRLDKQQYEHEDSAYQYSLFMFTFFISKCR